MSRSTWLLLPLSLSLSLLVGCSSSLQGSAARSYPVTLDTVEPKLRSAQLEAGVNVLAVPITQGNWLEHREVLKHVVWNQADTASGPRATGEGAGFGTSNTVVRWDDFSLVPLPAFRIEVQNHSGKPVSFAHVQVELDDGRGQTFPAFARREDVSAYLERGLTERHPELRLPANRTVLDSVQVSLAEVPLVLPDVEVKDGAAWAGFVGFRMEARDPDEFARLVTGLSTLRVRVSGLEAGGMPLPPTELTFSVARRPPSVSCPDGSKAPSVRQCKRGVYGENPVSHGPCIQETKIPFKMNATQLWVGSTPIANSDLNRMLLTESVTHSEARRGLAYRWAGYTIIAAGIMGSLGLAVGLAKTQGESTGPIGLSMLALVPVGAVLAYKAHKLNDHAVGVYNEQAEATGICVPRW